MQEFLENNENITINEIIKTVGKRISSARKESKQKIDKISRKLKIRTDFLAAIEEGRLEDLPEEVYLKGFIKSYANYFDLNIDREMQTISYNYSETKNSRIEEEKIESQIESLPTAKVFVIVFAIFLLVIISWSEFKKNKIDYYSIDEEKKTDRNVGQIIINKEFNNPGVQEKIDNSLDDIVISEEKIDDMNSVDSHEISTEIANEPIQEELVSKEIFEDSKKNIEVMILFFDTTWIQIRNTDGFIIKSGIFEKEEIINVAFDEKNVDYFIDTGNAGGFKLLSDNKEFPLLGELGSVRKNVSLLEYFNKYSNMQ